MSELKAEDLKVGRVFCAKRPSKTGSLVLPVWNDREIIWVGLFEVQYDGPTVKTGSRYKIITKEKFLSWAKSDITDEMPKDGSWRPAY